MSRAHALSAPFIALALSACQTLAPPPQQEPALAAIPGALTVPIKALDNREVGLLTLAEGPRGVLIRINLLPNALSPGWHGLHFHETGDCGGQAFSAAGAHAGHGDNASHGLLNPEGPEQGDLPNLLVPIGQRPTVVELYSSTVSVTGARFRTKLSDADGAAFVIHSAPDDHTSQPIGGAGGRVACAVIPPTAEPAAPPARRGRRQP